MDSSGRPALSAPDPGTIDLGTILIVDDDDNNRLILVQSLRSAGYKVHEYASPRAFLDGGPHEDAGCLILELFLSEMSGLQLHGMLRDGAEPPAVVFVSAHADVPAAVEAMKGGAVDLLCKPLDPDALLAAVARAVSLDKDRRAARAARRQAAERYGTLSPQEARVCRLVAEGHLNKQVAAALGITEKTVSLHRRRAMEKLGVDSMAALMRFLAYLD